MSRRKRVERSIRRLISADTLEELFRGTPVERSLTFVVLDELAAQNGEFRAVAERVARREGVTYEYLVDRVMVFVASVNEIRSRDLFRQLGVPRSATMEDIRRRWRTVAKELHPDSGGGDPEAFLKARDAYETLADPDRRGRYEGYWSRQVAPVEQAAMLAGIESSSSTPSVEPAMKPGTGGWRQALSQLSWARRNGLAILREQSRRLAILMAEVRQALRRWIPRLGEGAGNLLISSARRLSVWAETGMRLGSVAGGRVRAIAGSAERMVRLVSADLLNSAHWDRWHSWSIRWWFRLGRAVAQPVWQRTAVTGAAVFTIGFVMALFYTRQQTGPNLDRVLPDGSVSSRQSPKATGFSPASGLTAVFHLPQESRVLSPGERPAVSVAASSSLVADEGNSAGGRQPRSESQTVAARVRGQLRSADAGAGQQSGSGQAAQAAVATRESLPGDVWDIRTGTEDIETAGEGEGPEMASASGASVTEPGRRAPPAAEPSGVAGTRVALPVPEPAGGAAASSRIVAAMSGSLASSVDTQAVGLQGPGRKRRPAESQPSVAAMSGRKPLAAEVAGSSHRTRIASSAGRIAAGGQVIGKRVVARGGPRSTASLTAKTGALGKGRPRREAGARGEQRGVATEVSLGGHRESTDPQARGFVVPAKEKTDALAAASKSARMVVSRDEAIDFVERFRRIYEQRDAAALSRLFAENASENEMVGRQRIAAAYRGTFGEMGRVRYFLGDAEVRPLGAWADVRAPFTIAYRETTGRYGELSGRAHWWLVRDGHGLKVLRLEYEIDAKSR